MRTPLNAIIGFSEVLHEQMFGELNERQLGYVDDVLEAGQPPALPDQRRARPREVEAGRMELELSQVGCRTTSERRLRCSPSGRVAAEFTSA